MTKFCVVVAAYNCLDHIENCLQSISEQSYSNFSVCVVDDNSDDQLQRDMIEKYCTQHNWSQIFNDQRMGALYNQVMAIKTICTDPDDVIVFCDGDDALSYPNVLHKLNKIYEGNSDIELTYGSYQSVPHADTCPPVRIYPQRVIRNRTYREFTKSSGIYWNHLRTFKFKLFQQMDEDIDFKDENGEWFLTSPDTAMMTPALELAKEHRYVSDTLYNYTSSNPISEWRIHSDLVNKNSAYILNLPKKERCE